MGEVTQATPSKPRSIWNTWSEPVDGLSVDQIRLALLYHLKYNDRAYWRTRGITPNSIRKFARQMYDDMPVDWVPPYLRPKTPVPDQHCSACFGKGKVRVRLQDRNGTCAHTFEDCTCLKVPA